MNRQDFSYTYNDKGYMLQYKGHNLGGAGTMPSGKPKHWRHKRADLEMYREECEREIRHILSGNGQGRFLEIIKGVDSKPA